MRGEIRRLCKDSGLTAIYVSHDQKEALAIGDRIVVLDRGTVRQEGTPLEVYRPATVAIRGGVFGPRPTCWKARPPARPSRRERAVWKRLPGIARETCWSRSGPRRGGWARAREAVNSFPGRIVETVYLGEMARHRFALESGSEIIVFELNPQPPETTRLHATVNPADVVPILEP